MIKSENETLNKKVFSRRQKDAEDTMSSGKLFQTFGAATGNACCRLCINEQATPPGGQ